MRVKWLVGAAVVAAAALVHCGAHYKPLDIAESCACRTSEYCSVAAGGHVASLALPVACGARPTCDCVGNRGDACRDEDGRLTLFPTRDVASCNDCSSQEYCSASHGAGTCRVLPPECADTPTCACFLGSRNRSATWACTERSGHIVASAR